jgi:hypothetical protein
MRRPCAAGTLDVSEDIDPVSLTPQRTADCRAWIVAGGATRL